MAGIVKPNKALAGSGGPVRQRLRLGPGHVRFEAAKPDKRWRGAFDPLVGELHADEGFLKSIEEQIAIIGSAADGFRQEVIAYLWATSRRGEKISYQSYEPLKEAIEKKIQCRMDSILPAQVVSLGRIYNSLRDGMSKPQEWFDIPQEQPKASEEIAGLNDLAKAAAEKRAKA